MLHIYTETPIRESDPITVMRLNGHSTMLPSHLNVHREALRGWNGYTLSLHGVVVLGPPLRPHDDWPCWRLEIGPSDNRELVTIQIHRARAAKTPTAAQAVIEWSPGKQLRTLIEIHGDKWTPGHLDAAGRGLKLLRGMTLQGKKEGDGATWPGGVPEFLEDLWDTIDRYQRATGNRWPKIIGERGKTFRVMMKGHPSERTLRDWLLEAELRPKDIESGKVTQANYSQFVAEKAP